MDSITIHPCQKLSPQPWYIPPSKSWSYRHIFAGMIKNSSFSIHNALYSNDIKTLLNSLQWQHQFSDGQLTVHPTPLVKNSIIDVGNSGLAMRFLMGYCASLSVPIILTGDESICQQRPIATLVDVLREGGVQVEYLGKEGFGPIKILGPFHGGHFELEVLDSQYASALMIAGALCPSPTHVKFSNLHEWPWLQLSHAWLASLGANIELTQAGMKINPSTLNIPPQFKTPCDWSSAAFAIGAHIITQSPGIITGLDWPSTQGDSKIGDWLIQNNLGYFKQSKLLITPGSFQGQTLNMDHWIDATPIMSVLLTHAQTPSQLTHLFSATQKECNRPKAIQSMLSTLNIKTQFTENKLNINPGLPSGGHLRLDHDHRMALSAMVLALGAKNPITIAPYHSIDKTYPQFMNELEIRGVTIT
jgi:3-phosphoshikimate 1-carboxyvinyltransferase